MGNYNWWKDPKNKEEVEKLSWWNHDENIEIINFPIAVIKEGEYWTASTNNLTSKLLGDKLTGCASAKTKEEAIQRMFNIVRITHEYSEECRLSYQRWVPFRNGPWGQIGGNWIIIFGILIYFRYGKKMKGGWYLPLTKLNISITNEWRYKKT